jgi:hypothetical protein
MRTLVPCHGLWQAARLLPALLTSCVVVSAPGPAAAADGCQVFGDPVASPPVVAVQDVIGTYRRMPVQNGYHTGSLALAPGSTGTLVWTNAAGVSWTLTPDLARQRLLTGADNPYQSSGIQDFTLAFQGNELVGFRFGNELYELDGALADQFDFTTGQLTIHRISVGGTRYCRVVVTPGQVVNVGSAPPQGNEDSFDPASGRITMPVVRAGGTLYYNVVVTLGSLLSYNVLPSYGGSSYTGYASIGVQDAPPDFRYGISLYTSIQQVAGYQISGLQFGWGTWLMPDNRATPFSLCPPGTVMHRIAPDRWWDVFQTIEGGPGQWVSTRIPSSQSKWRANSTPNCYNDEMSSPGYGFGDVAGPDALGLAQLSNRLVIPPDGWTFNLGGQASGLFGYGYLALPVIPGNGLTGAQAVGNQNWTLLVNSSNFKGAGRGLHRQGLHQHQRAGWAHCRPRLRCNAGLFAQPRAGDQHRSGLHLHRCRWRDLSAHPADGIPRHGRGQPPGHVDAGLHRLLQAGAVEQLQCGDHGRQSADAARRCRCPRGRPEPGRAQRQDGGTSTSRCWPTASSRRPCPGMQAEAPRSACNGATPETPAPCPNTSGATPAAGRRLRPARCPPPRTWRSSISPR